MILFFVYHRNPLTLLSWKYYESALFDLIMGESEFLPGGLAKDKIFRVGRVVSVLSYFAGIIMIFLGLISLIKVGLGISNFSMPQAAQGMLGGVLIFCSANGLVSRYLIKGLLHPSGRLITFLLPFGSALFIVIYRALVINSSEKLESYKRTITEGSLVEWIGFLALLASAILLLKAARNWYPNASRYLLLSASAVCFLVGMEEMSWGQMIFNWDTPSLVGQYNVQDETGFHNLWFIHDQTWIIGALVMTLFLLLSLSGFLLRSFGLVRPLSFADILLPLGCTASYFLVASVFYWLTVVDKSGAGLVFFHSREQEIGELFFYCGILIHSVYAYLVSPRSQGALR